MTIRSLLRRVPLAIAIYERGRTLLRFVGDLVVPALAARSRARGAMWPRLYFRQGELLYIKIKLLMNERQPDVGLVRRLIADATDYFDLALSADPKLVRGHRFVLTMQLFLGNAEEYTRRLELYGRAKAALSMQYGWDKLGLRFINPEPLLRTIGNTGTYDGYFKAAMLGLRPHTRTVLLITPGTTAPVNPHLLTYWRRYIDFIDDPLEVKRLSPMSIVLADEDSGPFQIGDRFLAVHSAMALAQRAWEAEGRRPLFELREDDRVWGRDMLADLGVPKGAWFVCLHVRGSGAKGDEPFRQASIDNYLAAIEAVTQRGGWVIRMGDPSMPALPPLPQVIDYVHSSARSPRMDVFLCAECRFFIGTSSGLYTVAYAFGRPVVQTNYLPTCTIHFSARDLFIPKLARRLIGGEMLSMRELMSAPFSMGGNNGFYRSVLGVEPIANTEDEIREVVEEMMDRLDGVLISDAKDEARQRAFHAMTADAGTLIGLDNFPVNSRIGSAFLRRHAHLMPTEENCEIKKYVSTGVTTHAK
jgi:putative glycosyltransferase (TIGR04372 family)